MAKIWFITGSSRGLGWARFAKSTNYDRLAVSDVGHAVLKLNSARVHHEGGR